MRKWQRFRNGTLLLKLPGNICDVVDEPSRNDQINGSKDVVIGNSPGFYASTDHYPHIRYKECENTEDGEYVENFFIGSFLSGFRSYGEEQHQVRK